MAHLHAGTALVTRARKGVSFRDLGDPSWHREDVDDQHEYPYARHLGVAVIRNRPMDVWKVGDDLFAQAQENPVSAKVWWILGLSSAGAALGLGIWAVTRSGQLLPGQ